MLETIREYAIERLEEDPEFSSSIHRIHATFYADFTKEHYDRFLGNEREEALKEIEPDIENMQIAWRYWVAEGDLKQLQKLTDFLWMLYDARGWYYATINLTTDLLKVLDSTPSTPDLSQQEIMLQMSLARVLLSVKGYTSEVEDAYNRALNLCNKYGEIPQMFPVLRTLASFYTYTSKFMKGIELGEQILNLSESLDDKNMRLEGHLLKGYSLAFSGNVKQGIEHLEKGISIYDPEKQATHSFRFGNNPIVTCHTTSALCQWMLGFLDSSLKHADESLILANKLNHPFSLAYALFHTGLLNLLMWESEIALERAKAVLEIAEKFEFQIWKAVATCLYGASLSGMSQAEDGLKEIKRGMEMYAELKTPPVFWPMLLLLQAGSLIQAERPKEGLTIIDEALGIFGREPGNPFLPEIYRIKGDVLLLVSPEKVIDIESLLKEAMEIAKKQQTLIFELRAAVSLYRLWQLNGKSDQGRQVLKNVYDKFTEGFTTIDLIAARDLLDNMS